MPRPRGSAWTPRRATTATGSARVVNAVSTCVFLDSPICVVSGMRATPARGHWPSFTYRRHLCAGLFARSPPIIRIGSASSLFCQPSASFFRHDTTETWMAGTKLSEIRVVASYVLTLPSLRPFRTLLSVVGPTVEGVLFREPAHAFTARRSNPGGFPHLGRPLDAHRPQTSPRQIE